MIRQKILDKELLEHLSTLPDDVREVYLMANNEIRLSAVSCTHMVNQMVANHKTGLLETYILGQGYIAGALLSSEVKGNDRIQLSLECGGPVKGMSIEAWACGAVRGYLMQNPIPLDKPLESLDTNPIYGPGFLSISKILEGSKTPFTGQIMMEYGHLAQDLALYYQQSAETPSLFSLSIKFDSLGRVVGAGGLFLQALPGCPENTLIKLQEKASTLSDIGTFLSSGGNIRDYVEKEFADYGVMHLDHAPIGFSCPCSEKAFRRYIVTLPQKEKDEILKGEFPLVLQCFNCGTEYKYSKSDLEALFMEANT
ncbi:MAG: Hsp33 family molecular chaperone HslO [Spirochaetales bacterium]|nr:Hsp33 family molecular chaperone HslO [Candidatus Physcosoma equi]